MPRLTLANISPNTRELLLLSLMALYRIWIGYLIYALLRIFSLLRILPRPSEQHLMVNMQVLGIGGCFSFYPAKTLGCLGDGGAVITPCSKIASKVSRFGIMAVHNN